MIGLQDKVEETRRERAKLFENLAELKGSNWCLQHTQIADGLIREIFSRLLSPEQRDSLALVATGGYGRAEVAPFSDLDLAFVPQNENDPETELIVRTLFREIIDAFASLGWPVGYAYRLKSDLPAMDSTSRSSLIDGRLVCGSESAWTSLREHFWATFPTAEFIIDKLQERARFHDRWHNTTHVAEPHLRDGVGALRDYQTMQWISKATNCSQTSADAAAYEALLRIRNVLHVAANRRQDQLVRARKEACAELVGIRPVDLDQLVYESLEANARAYDETVHAAKLRELPLAPGVHAVGGSCVIGSEATLSNAALGVSRATKLGIRISHCAELREADDVPRLTQVITEGEPTLRGLELAGILTRILPEIAECFRRTPADSVHQYTIGEHSLRLIERLDSTKEMVEFSDVWSEIANSRSLYLAGLLHDAGKLVGDRPHEIVGAELAEKVCARLQLSPDESEDTEWLIRNHLVMAKTARTHDIAHPRTATEFARFCETPVRMAMLYLLTWADIAAVSSESLSAQLESSLEELFAKSRSLIEGPKQTLDAAQYRIQGVQRLKAAGRANQDVEALLQSMPTHYLLSTPVELFQDHAELVRRAQEGEINVLFQHRLDTQQTDMTVCMHDLPEPGLLSRILGILYAHDVNLHSVRVASTVGDRRIALDVLTVSYQNRTLPAGLCSILASDIKTKSTSAQQTNDLMVALGKEPHRKQSMFTYTFSEGTPAVLEIETPPGRGMPYRVSRMLADFGWNIEVARIGQWAGRAVARFYIDLPLGGNLSAEQVDAALAGLRR